MTTAKIILDFTERNQTTIGIAGDLMYYKTISKIPQEETGRLFPLSWPSRFMPWLFSKMIMLDLRIMLKDNAFKVTNGKLKGIHPQITERQA